MGLQSGAGPPQAGLHPLGGPRRSLSGATTTFEFSAQRQPLRHTKAVLLVDDGQRQVLEHHPLLDDGVGAHHQRGLATGHQGQHGVALFFLLAAEQPGHLQAARRQKGLQPADELAEMLLGQDLGGRHQCALPAGVDAHRRRQRGHHRLASAHIALQQTVHGHGAGQVAGDLFAHAALGAGEGEGQHGQQFFVQGACAFRRGLPGHQHGRPQPIPLAPRHQLG